MACRLIALLLFWVGTLGAAPIGIQNSNPGNVVPWNWHTWSGATGLDPYGHAIFKDDLHGFRAIKRVLKCYDKKHHIDTPYAIAKRYINKKATVQVRLEYAKTLCQFTGGGAHDKLDMRDKRVLMALAHGIVRHENGMDPYPESLYRRVFLLEE